MKRGEKFLRMQRAALRNLRSSPRYYAAGNSYIISMARRGWIERTGDRDGPRVEYRLTQAGLDALEEPRD